MAVPQDALVDDRVHRERDDAENELRGPRQILRVQQWQEIMRDEIALIDRPSAALTQIVFERCERTDRSGELDEDAPRHGGQVRPDSARPSLHDDAAEQHESDEGKMNDDDCVGQKPERESQVAIAFQFLTT